MTGFMVNAVTVEQAADVLKRKPAEVEAEARSLGLHIGEDWAGRPALLPDHARKLVSGAARRAAEHDREQQAMRRATEEWVRHRREVAQTAHQEEAERLRGQGRSGGEALAKATAASHEAGRQFELTNPRPNPGAEHLMYSTEEEVAARHGGVVGRIKEAIGR